MEKSIRCGGALTESIEHKYACSLHFGGQPKQINLNWRGCQYGSHAGFYAKPATGQRYGSWRGNKQTGNYRSEENVRIARIERNSGFVET